MAQTVLDPMAMNEELRSQLRKRLEVARRLRFQSPVMSVEILCDLLDEVLKRT